MSALSVSSSHSSLLHLPKTLTSTPPPPPRHLLLKHRYPPRRLSSAFAPAAASSSSSSAIPIADIVERDWSFLEADATSFEERALKLRRIVAAGGIQPESKVLVALPTPTFVDRLVEDTPCELLVAIHESLLVLAIIKENHDRVRCWQGGVDVVPQKFAQFDVLFICYFPGMGVSLEDLLNSLTRRCAPGARVVLSFDQGKEIIERQHRQLHPDLVAANLPDKIALEKAATDYLFKITDFIDEPSFYLAVLRYQN